MSSWLAESVPFSPRIHAAALLLIVALGLARGLFWVVTTEVWNPIDEIQHYDYVRSLAEGDGMPVVGKDKVTDEILMTAKVSPTLWFHYEPLQPTVSDPSWGGTRESYEGGGVQGPLYYLLMVVPYWLSHPFGILPALFAVRLATVLVSLLAVPLAWVLARELLPERPAVWLAAPALLVLFQGFNSNLASVNNDALMVPIAVATLVPVARAWRGLTLRQAAAAGMLFGLAMMTKPTNLALAPIIGVAIVGLVALRRESIGSVIRWSVTFGAVAFVVLMPYVAWNLFEYHSFSARQEVYDITGRVLPSRGLSLDAFQQHWRSARTGFFDFQLYSAGPDSEYIRTLERAALAVFLISLVVAAARRNRRETTALAWMGLALPLAFMSTVSITYGLFSGAGSPVGRHLYAALVPVCIVIAGGAIITLGPRWGGVALLLLVALAFGGERQATMRYVDVSYTAGLLGDLAPRVDQSWNDAYVPDRIVRAAPPCPVEVIGVGISGDPPPAVDVSHNSVLEVAELRGSDGNIALYALQKPLMEAFEVAPPAGALIGSSREDREPLTEFTRGSGDPMVRLYCKTEDAKAERFEQRYGPQHPGFMTYQRISVWTSAWEWLGWVALAIGVAAAVGWEIRSRLRRSPQDDAGSYR